VKRMRLSMWVQEDHPPIENSVIGQNRRTTAIERQEEGKNPGGSGTRSMAAVIERYPSGRRKRHGHRHNEVEKIRRRRQTRGGAKFTGGKLFSWEEMQNRSGRKDPRRRHRKQRFSGGGVRDAERG